MGNTSECPMEELVFVQALEDRHFGEVEIFRSQAGVFVMKAVRTAIAGERRQQEQLRLMEELQGVASVIPVIHMRRTEEKGLCIKYERLEIFTEYYNFTLADLLATKRDLEEGELWLLLTWLLHLALDLRARQVAASLALDTIFLTPAGAPCLYHYHIRSCRDTLTCGEPTTAQTIGRLLLQLALGAHLADGPQEELREKQLLGRLAVKHKLLGDLVRQLVSGAAGEAAAAAEVAALREEELIHVAAEVKLLKFKYHLPENPHFLNLPALPALPALSKTPTSAAKLADKENAPSHPLARSTSKRPPTAHGASQQEPSRKALQTEESNGKERRISEASSVFHNSSTKKEGLLKTKEETAKMLGELDRKKEEYRLQREKFELRKEELMRAGKENGLHQHQQLQQQRKSERRKEEERKATEPSRNARYR